jgi:CheY-like chemotaxis protein
MVFIDDQMPNLDGTMTIQLLRGINFDKIIIGITGNERDGFCNSGIDYVFTKPFNKNKINIITNFLNKNDIIRYNNKKLKLINSELLWQ